MIHDYDWVVIGDSPEAQFAAEQAGRLRARVAWVNQVAMGQQAAAPGFRAEVMLHYLQQAVGRRCPSGDRLDAQALWQQARLRAEIAVAEREPQRWQRVGVDVIEGLGRFTTQPRLQLNVTTQAGMRELRSRHYLLAPAARPQGPSALGETAAPPEQSSGEAGQDWTAWPTLPQRLIIVGAEPDGLVLAQLMTQLGCRVTLVAAQTSLLPSFDPELATLATALLQAAGVELRLGMGSPADCWNQGQLLLQAHAAQCPGEVRLLSRQGWRPHWPGLNLEAVGLSSETAAGVDQKQRTRHRQVWGCGAAVAHGPGRDALAQHQAEVALRNGLWWPWWSSQENAVVKTLSLAPTLAQAGLTEPQARKRHGDQITVVRQYAKDSWTAQQRDQPLGLCKLVVHRNGRLLGAQALAAGAEDWMGAAAMVIRRKGSVKDLTRGALPRDRPGHLLDQAAAQWRWDRLEEAPRREDLIERFFNWRRTGSV